MKSFKEAEGYADDLQAAYDHYKAYGASTATRFLEAYVDSVNVIVRHPFICRTRRNGWRQMVLTGYSNYSIFYKELPEFWVLAGIVSTLKDPDTIQARLLIREAGEEAD